MKSIHALSLLLALLLALTTLTRLMLLQAKRDEWKLHVAGTYEITAEAFFKTGTMSLQDGPKAKNNQHGNSEAGRCCIKQELQVFPGAPALLEV